MKKHIVCALVFLVIFASVYAQRPAGLDEVIKQSARDMSARLPSGTKLVIFDVRADRPAASEYIMDQLTLELLNIGKVIIVDRKSIEAIRQELSFQMSGDVSDESAQRLGSMLGAQTLVTGSFELIKDVYRLSLKAVRIETSEIQYLTARQVIKNQDTDALTGRAPTPSAVGSAARKVADVTGRFIFSTINPFFGIGSFIQGDTGGGSTVVFWEAIGIGALVYSVSLEEGTTSDRWTAVGTVCLGIGIVYSWIRPWTYNRSPRLGQTLDNVKVEWTGGNDVSVGYRLQLK